MVYTVTNTEITGNVIKCKLHAPNRTAANHFRRILMSEIPTFAIEMVEISSNTSNVYDEVLGHRLSLIPFCCDTDADECVLDVYAENQVRNVTAADLCVSEGIRPCQEDILICKLHPGQYISLKAYLKEGTGKTHVKWSPVTVVTFTGKGPFDVYIETIGMVPGLTLLEKALSILNEF